MIKVGWSEFKSYVNSSGVNINYIENDNSYNLFATNGSFVLNCMVIKNVDDTEFVSDYKAISNRQETASLNPFTAKKIQNGKKLFKRVSGVKKNLNGNTIFEYVVPYDNCKINAVEILWAPKGLMVDLKVYDTPTGTISTVPNYMLNQFGFSVAVAEGFHREESSYDADLIKDLKVEVTVINSNNLTDEIAVNFIIHEVKD